MNDLTEKADPVTIDPTLNYLVSQELDKLSMAGLGGWTRLSALNLVCGMPNISPRNKNRLCPGVPPERPLCLRVRRPHRRHAKIGPVRDGLD